jgi:hypothetical protein
MHLLARRLHYRRREYADQHGTRTRRSQSHSPESQARRLRRRRSIRPRRLVCSVSVRISGVKGLECYRMGALPGSRPTWAGTDGGCDRPGHTPWLRSHGSWHQRGRRCRPRPSQSLGFTNREGGPTGQSTTSTKESCKGRLAGSTRCSRPPPSQHRSDDLEQPGSLPAHPSTEPGDSRNQP